MASTGSIGTFDTPRIEGLQYATYRELMQSAAMDEPKDRLKEARAKAGFKSAAAAWRHYKFDITESGYRHHENGTRDLDYRDAQIYAKAYGTTPEWLMDGRLDDEPELGPRQIREVRLLSWVGAGKLGPVAPIESIEHNGTFPVGRLPPGDWVALSVEGNSMDRIAVDGSTIIVNRRERTPMNGKFYVFCAKDGETTFKRYRINPERFAPYSTDPDEEPIYPSLEPDREWQVFGRVHRVLTDI